MCDSIYIEVSSDQYEAVGSTWEAQAKGWPIWAFTAEEFKGEDACLCATDVLGMLTAAGLTFSGDDTGTITVLDTQSTTFSPGGDMIRA